MDHNLLESKNKNLGINIGVLKYLLLGKIPFKEKLER